MEKEFLQPKIEIIFLNDNIVLTSNSDVDNVVGFPENPNKTELNGDL